MGLFNEHTYNDVIKSVVEQVREENVDLITSCKIFKNINKGVFNKLYYQKFIGMTYPRYSKVFQEGEQKQYIYFNKDGDFEMKFSKSLFEIGEIIKKLKGEKCINPEHHKFQTEDKDLYQMMNEKRVTKLFITQKIDVSRVDEF